ncbi:hypothetical protein FGG23_gp089 [Mycobacterium phage Ibhubesi]|uniref:Uncharacterized protein n=1 Tax=Mycobacterium phage Ibhubesi TaxID=2922205 RepID=G1D335_9CAUD|nr:hypothetical protein FGG23_gp089 [Mycobacterium phage Ibhubesi]AEK09185.1 hypothetical protein PBI_IBHUBESI_89 [Mycobacterium phage Ibhubesi]
MSGVFPAPHRAFHRLQRTPHQMIPRYSSKDVCTSCFFDSCECCRGGECACQKFNHPVVGSIVQSEPNQEGDH